MLKFSVNQLPIITKVKVADNNANKTHIETENVFILAINGKSIFKLQNEEYCLTRGDVLIIPSNTEFTRICDEKNVPTLFFVHFILPLEEITTKQAQLEISDLKKNSEQASTNGEVNLTAEYFYVLNLSNLSDDYKKVLEYVSEMTALYESKNVLNKTHVSTVFEHILSVLSLNTQEELQKYIEMENMATMPEYIKRSVLYVKTHLSERITLEKLCSLSTVSPQQLIRSFKKFFNKTPNEYITDFKIDKAKTFLISPNSMSVKDIAYELGYDDQCYFSRVFFKITGKPQALIAKE